MSATRRHTALVKGLEHDVSRKPDFTFRRHALDHDDFGLNQSKVIVIDSKGLERDASGKPATTFPHPALARNWEGGLGFDIFQSKARRHSLERNDLDQSLVEGVERRCVGRDDAQDIIDVARHAVQVHDLLHGGEIGGEAREGLARMIADLDRYEHRDAEPQFARVEQSDAAFNHAGAFEALEPLPAGRLRKPNLRRYFADRQGCVFLHDAQDPPVDRVQAFRPIHRSATRERSIY
jgi:hypothetical protein